MTCERHQSALALYVEGDLAPDADRGLEAHLSGCVECSSFLAELTHTQQAIKDLARVTLDEGALHAVSERVAEALRRRPQPSGWSLPNWRWAMAASLFLAVVGVVAWRASRAPLASPPSLSPAAPPAPAPAVAQHAERAPINPAALTLRSKPRILSARHSATGRGGTAAEGTLSTEDADQLARAVVAVSGIDRLRDVSGEGAEYASQQQSQVIQLATEDPNVVIYWQIDSNGG
jgi:hypothetical protein